MPKVLQLQLTDEQRHGLMAVRDHSPKAYLRERAAALLKIADGQITGQVAENGLLKRHEPETVSGWLRAYQAAGIAGLTIKPGRGRKPKFFPPELDQRRDVATNDDPAQSATQWLEPEPLDAGRPAAGDPMADQLHASRDQ